RPDWRPRSRSPTAAIPRQQPAASLRPTPAPMGEPAALSRSRRPRRPAHRAQLGTSCSLPPADWVLAGCDVTWQHADRALSHRTVWPSGSRCTSTPWCRRDGYPRADDWFFFFERKLFFVFIGAVDSVENPRLGCSPPIDVRGVAVEDAGVNGRSYPQGSRRAGVFPRCPLLIHRISPGVPHSLWITGVR